MREWHWIQERPCNAKVNYVRVGDQLGFPKFENIVKEKLASDLGQLLGVPIPIVEIGTIPGYPPAAVSYVLNLQSRSLRGDEQVASAFSSAESSALKDASGLLPFLAWIESNDHTKDSNFVVEYLDGDIFQIIAVDFEHAFAWTANEERKHVINPPSPPGLSTHFDSGLVNKTLMRIEDLTNDEITDCCMKVCASGAIGEIASALELRKNLLRGRLRETGWLAG